MEPIQPEASIASTGKGIRYIGEHCYAYAEQLATSDAQDITTMLSFTTGSGYIVAKWTVCGTVNKDGAHVTGGIDQFYVSFNGVIFRSIKTDTGEEDQPGTYTTPLIIPPFTEVLCQGTSSQNNSSWLISQAIIGRVYGAA